MLKSDPEGFLVGDAIDDAKAVDLLSDIKGDTGRILAALQRSTRIAQADARRAAAAQGMAPASRARARAERVGHSTASAPAPGGQPTHAPRPMAHTILARDARGRWLPAAGGAAGATGPAARGESAGRARPSALATVAQRADQPPPVRAVALAATAAAKSAGDAAREVKNAALADAAATRKRDALGRFGSGGDGKPAASDAAPKAADGFARRMLAALGKSLGRAGDMGDGNAIDPALAALGEAKRFVTGTVGVASPIVTALSGGRRAKAGEDGDAKDGAREEKRQTGLLSRILKALRRPAVTAAAGGAGAGASAGAGALSMLTPGAGAVAAVAGGAGAALGAAARFALAGAKSLAKRLPIIGAAIEVVDAAVESSKLDDRKDLTDEEKSRERGGLAGQAVGAITGAVGGAKIGALAGSLFGPAGTVAGGVIGGVVGGIAGSKAGKALGQSAMDGLGWVSKKFESGGRGAGTVSTGRGDAGGASYGTHQLSSRRGVVQDFLKSTGYGDQFAGMTPGTPEFDAQWKRVAAQDPAFAKAQHDYITATHYQPQVQTLAKAGIDLSGRGGAVQEAIYSTAVQYGPRSSVIRKALQGADVASLSDADIISRIQDYKAANNDTLMASSSADVRAGVLGRIGRERSVLLSSLTAPATAAPPTVATATPAAMLPVQVGAIAPPPPQIPKAVTPPPPDMGAVATRPGPPAAPPTLASQEVGDRGIAHIASGGIGRQLLAR